MRELTFTALGFLVAALPIAVLFALTSPGLGGGIDGDPVTILGLVFLFWWYALFFSLVFGGPLLLLLRKFGLVRWWSSVAAGVLIGVVVAELIVPGSSRDTKEHISFLSVCGGTGAGSALLFWLVWRRGAVLRAADSVVIDKLVLSQASEAWQNLARVIARVQATAERRGIAVAAEVVAERVEYLVADRRLDRRGDADAWRSSELKLHG